MKLKDIRGAFLLEVLLAAVILGVGLTAIIQSFSIGLEGYQRSQDYQKAAILLENKLSDLLLERYFHNGIDTDGIFDEPFKNYRYEIKADDVDHSDILKKVQVTIYWPSRNGERILQATTLLLKQPEEGV